MTEEQHKIYRYEIGYGGKSAGRTYLHAINTIMTEQQLQAQCFQWHWNTYPSERRMLYHTNNNSLHLVSGIENKAIGVIAGVSDFTLIIPNRVIFIELKLPGGVQSSAQKLRMHLVQDRNHIYVVIGSDSMTGDEAFEEFKNFINQLYGK